jgi:hypothetical protein
MSALTPAQLAILRQKIATLRAALSDFERALGDLPPPDTAIAAELEEFIEKNVPQAEVDRLSELVPKLSELHKDPPDPK